MNWGLLLEMDKNSETVAMDDRDGDFIFVWSMNQMMRGMRKEGLNVKKYLCYLNLTIYQIQSVNHAMDISGKNCSLYFKYLFI